MKNRDCGLDFLKFICAFLVVCIHIQFPSLVGKVVTPITRIAVPIFFMITGYYYSFTKKNKARKKQIFKIVKLFIGANIFYFLLELLFCFILKNDIHYFIDNIFNIKTILKFIFFNESPFGGHLWYLGALLYVLLIIWFIDSIGSIKKIYFLIPFLLLTDLVFGKYSLLFFGKEFPYILVRNFLFVGLPYFLIGDMLYNYKPKMKTKYLLLFSVLFLILTLTERYFLGIYNLNATRDHYFSTTFLAIFVFLLVFKLGDKIKSTKGQKLSFLVSKLSLGIYIIHPLFIKIFNIVIYQLSENKYLLYILNYLVPFIIFGVSAFIVYLFMILKEKNKKPIK